MSVRQSSVAQLPILFALATKNSVLGITGKTYEKVSIQDKRKIIYRLLICYCDQLNFLHRFAGRCTLACGLIHSAFYLRSESRHPTRPSSHGALLVIMMRAD
jgi:hypothetical protein